MRNGYDTLVDAARQHLLLLVVGGAIAFALLDAGCRGRGGAMDSGTDPERDAQRSDGAGSEDDGGSGGERDGGEVGGPPHFVDVTAAAGLAVPHGEMRGPPNCAYDDPGRPGKGDFCDLDISFAGAAVGDVDGDGDDDLYVTRVYLPSSLYENLGDGTFREFPGALGAQVDAGSSGAAFADIDRDGDLDLYVTSVGGTRHFLFVREGERFVEQARERGAALETALPLGGSTPTFGDFDRDGDLDLYVGEWRNRRVVHDGPAMARLLRNRGPAMPGHFEDVTDRAGVSMEEAYVGVAPRGVYVYGAALTDVDGDRIPDLVVAGDFRTSRLFFGRGDGTFVDGTAAAMFGTESNAMGLSFGDVDGDGDLDAYVTSIWMGSPDSGNRLYRNLGARVFADATDEFGVRNSGWGWGTAFFDYDNDGDLDLVATNGWNLPDWANDPMRLWRNDGAGPMREVSDAEGLQDRGQGRGIVVFDADGDGDLDLFVARYGEKPILYRNERGNERAWLRVRARGRASAPDGTGARVYVRLTPSSPERMVEIGGTSHFLGQSERVAHFGLGDHEGPVDRVRVVFPSGTERTAAAVPARTLLTIDE